MQVYQNNKSYTLNLQNVNFKKKTKNPNTVTLHSPLSLDLCNHYSTFYVYEFDYSRCLI